MKILTSNSEKSVEDRVTNVAELDVLGTTSSETRDSVEETG